MPASTVYAVADTLISISYDKSSPVTNLKLQKLLYYAQAWYLTLYGESLFDAEIEAWVHGPVVPAIFRKYRENRWDPISNVATGEVSKQVQDHLEEVWRVFGAFRAGYLERLTHSEAPWIIARGGLPPDVSSNNVISRKSMRDYYSAVLNRQNKNS